MNLVITYIHTYILVFRSLGT